MKTQKIKFIFSWAIVSILSLAALNVFSAGAGQNTTIRAPQDSSGTAAGAAANPPVETVSPALQYCGKNYVKKELEKYPLEGSSPDQEGGVWWACQLRPGFNYSNYDPNDNACPAVPGEAEQLRTEGLQPISANYYGCSYKDKSQPPIAQCLSGFHAVDVQENKKGVGEKWSCYQSGKIGQKIQQHCTKVPEYYVYDTSFKCVRNGATFTGGNFEGDENACNPTTSWLGVWQGPWQAGWPYYQICGWKPDSSAPAPFPIPSGPPPPPQPLPR